MTAAERTYQGRSQDFLEGGATLFSRAAPIFAPEATPLINDVTINFSIKLGVAQSVKSSKEA